MNEQQARERAAELAKYQTQNLKEGGLKTFGEQMVYEGYMAAWRDAQ